MGCNCHVFRLNQMQAPLRRFTAKGNYTIQTDEPLPIKEFR